MNHSLTDSAGGRASRAQLRGHKAVESVCHMFRPVCQSVACAGNDGHPGTRDLLGLEPTLSRTFAPSLGSGG